MSPEDRELLERTYKIVEENNDILKSIRRGNRLSMALRLVYWGVILALSFGAYYFIQPYLEQVLSLYGQVQGNVDTVQNMTSKLGDLLK